MEEIDIIELLKRVKEGKAPKEIMINGDTIEYPSIVEMFDKINEIIRHINKEEK